MMTRNIQDGHPADQRPVYDLQRLWGREYEQAGVCLLLEWLDKEGLSSSPDDSEAKHESNFFLQQKHKVTALPLIFFLTKLPWFCTVVQLPW